MPYTQRLVGQLKLLIHGICVTIVIFIAAEQKSIMTRQLAHDELHSQRDENHKQQGTFGGCLLFAALIVNSLLSCCLSLLSVLQAHYC